ncbi:insulin-like receptor [Episyrphus balteatus]|uniref:insulin-like receptor n=1 Tax=Episyrphus balteatus TaxID=286459 RepID=UPI0024862D89|nr:insulin-like receptor [Episyrphus balteatus]
MKQKFCLGFLIIIYIQGIFAWRDEFTCDSIEIKNETAIDQLRKCVKVKGYVLLSNFRITKPIHINATKLEEISDYLLVYRVEGLRSLQEIFPKLVIIRGHNLLFDRYALVLYENRDIRNIGLKSLLKIRNGNIKIESNPVLCYADTVNWMYIVENHMKQHFLLKNNQNQNECPKCVKLDDNIKKHNISESKYFQFNCWNKDSYQLKKPVDNTTDCPKDCKDGGCSRSGKCCSPLCLSGCLAENCRICKDFKRLQGNCVATCNIPLYKLGDKCVTVEECKLNQFIPHAGYCIEYCPASYQQDFYYGIPECNLKCERNFTIRSIKDLELIKDCVIIKGSLHIELKGDQSENIIQELENVLGGITEIRDYLKVTKSPQIMSLGFLKRLDTIRGENLINNEVALFVVDNFHLEELWPDNHKIAIFKGRLFFHLNPMLCYEKILQLAPSLKSSDKIDIRDASHNSNGERNTCGSGVKLIYPVFEEANATAARVKLETRHSDDRYALLGYLYYIKEAPIKNVTMFDGRHGCGRDNWKMDMKLSPNIRHVFSNLKPNTQYAYFVKTFSSKENNHQSQAWYSPIQYFKTAQTKPGPVQKIYSIQIAKTATVIHWWPPKNSNGIIDKYIIRHVLTEHHFRYSQIFGYSPDRNESKDCECNIKQKIRIPPPSDMNYYNKEKILFEIAVQNFVYISSKQIEKRENETAIEDQSRRKRETTTTTTEVPTTTQTTTTTLKQDSTTESKPISDELSDMLAKHFAEQEKKSIKEQDTGIDNFIIIQPKEACPANSSSDYQKQNNCEIIETNEGTEVPGSMHSYILEDLEPEKIYQVFVRACVKDLPNGCGPEKFIEVETHSKKFETAKTDQNNKILFFF